jgi:hypothetical protein
MKKSPSNSENSGPFLTFPSQFLGSAVIASPALGQRTAPHPFSVAAGRDALSRWPTWPAHKIAPRRRERSRLASSQGLVTLSQMFARRSRNGSLAPDGGQK